jgi:phosphatidylserine/phosphatidylglycerophosphate/cardiolipin synthase-like enzyme
MRTRVAVSATRAAILSRRIRSVANSAVASVCRLDKVNATERYSGVNFVSDAGIRVWIDDQTAIAHSKVIVIDRALVVAGSFNLTRSAEERNVEDTLFVSSSAVAARFVANWQSRLAASTAWE